MRIACVAVCFVLFAQSAAGQGMEVWQQYQQQYQMLMMRIQEMDSATPQVLKQGLEHPEATYRYAAAFSLGKRKAPLHMERLIELLNDDDMFVQQIARWSLWKLSKGQDFGPLPGVTPEQVTASQTEWREWWEKKKK